MNTHLMGEAHDDDPDVDSSVTKLNIPDDGFEVNEFNDHDLDELDYTDEMDEE